MSKTASGLWIAGSPPQEPEITAPKPHFRTVLLTFVQPLVTFVGITVALYTLFQGNENFKIANRAYVTVTSKLEETPNAEFVVGLTLMNSGNTPAENIDVRHYIFSTATEPVVSFPFTNLEPVAARSNSSLWLSVKSLPEQLGDAFYSCVMVRYRDVFGQIQWHMQLQQYTFQPGGHLSMRSKIPVEVKDSLYRQTKQHFDDEGSGFR
jgi:hypothetical protein